LFQVVWNKNDWGLEAEKVPNKVEKKKGFDYWEPEDDLFEDWEETEDAKVSNKESKKKESKSEKISSSPSKQKDDIDNWESGDKVPRNYTWSDGKTDARRNRFEDSWESEIKASEETTDIAEKSKPLRRPFLASATSSSELQPSIATSSTVGNVRPSIAPQNPVRTAGRGTSFDCSASMVSDSSSVTRIGRGVAAETSARRFAPAPPTMMGVGRGVGRGTVAPPPGNTSFLLCIFNLVELFPVILLQFEKKCQKILKIA
jgi:hypothetical protein